VRALETHDIAEFSHSLSFSFCLRSAAQSNARNAV